MEVIAKAEKSSKPQIDEIEHLLKVPKNEETKFTFKLSKRLFNIISERAKELGMARGRYVRYCVVREIAGGGMAFQKDNNLPSSTKIKLRLIQGQLDSLLGEYKKLVSKLDSTNSLTLRANIMKDIRAWRTANIKRIRRLEELFNEVMKELPRNLPADVEAEIEEVAKRLNELVVEQ